MKAKAWDADLLLELSTKFKLPQHEVKRLLQAERAWLKTQIAWAERVVIPGFGTFTVRKRKQRVIRNPVDGSPMTLRASRTIHFRPTKAWRADL